MPGLYALSSWEALPLKSSRVKACANGYALSIAAHLVYTNPREEPVEGKRGCRNPKNPRAGEHPVPSPFTKQGPCSSDEFLGALPRGCLPPTGIFIYPLEESEVVAGFEAAVGSRRVTFQVQSRHRAQDCCLECRTSPGRPRRCAAGEYHGATIRMARWGHHGLESPSQAIPVPWRLLGLEIPASPLREGGGAAPLPHRSPSAQVTLSWTKTPSAPPSSSARARWARPRAWP